MYNLYSLEDISAVEKAIKIIQPYFPNIKSFDIETNSVGSIFIKASFKELKNDKIKELYSITNRISEQNAKRMDINLFFNRIEIDLYKVAYKEDYYHIKLMLSYDYSDEVPEFSFT